MYEYDCCKCGKKFAVAMSMSEYGHRKVTCPKCKSAKVRRRISSFYAQTSKKS